MSSRKISRSTIRSVTVNPIRIGDADGLHAIQIPTQPMEAQVWLEWVQLQVAQYTRESQAQFGVGALKPCEATLEML